MPIGNMSSIAMEIRTSFTCPYNSGYAPASVLMRSSIRDIASDHEEDNSLGREMVDRGPRLGGVTYLDEKEKDNI